jgi:hypothetical protein
MKSASILRFLALLAMLVVLAAMADEEARYRPFVLATVCDARLEKQAAATVAALELAGFSLAGQHAPLDTDRVLVVTHPELLEVAARTTAGGDWRTYIRILYISRL